jgi:WD40 repeat protein
MRLTLLCPQLCLPTGDGERVANFHRCDLFYSLLLPPLPGSASGGRALSQDVRRTKAVLWLWNDVPAAGRAAVAAAPQKLLLAGSSTRVLSCAVCAATSILASTDEEGNVYLFAIGAPTAALIGCHRVGSPLECLRMTLEEASLVLLCGARDGTIKLLLRSNDCDASASPASPLGTETREASPLLPEPAAEGDVSLAKAPTLEALPLPLPLALLAESTTPGHSDWVTQIALRPQHFDRKADAKGTAREEGMGLFCSASRDHSVRVWHVDVHSRTAPSIRVHCLHVLHGHARWVTGLAIGAARAHLCSPADPIGAHGHPLTTADGDNRPIPFVVSASADGTLRVWRLTDGVCLGVLEGHTRSVTDLDLRGARVLSASMDGTIRSWELAPLLIDQRTFSRRPDANAVASDGPAAQGQEGDEVRDVERIHRVSHHLCMRGHDDFVRTCRFDQRRVVSASDDNKVLVWAFDSAVMPGASWS